MSLVSGDETSLESAQIDLYVGPGQYEVVRGSADSITFESSALEEWSPGFPLRTLPNLLAGVRHWGRYNLTDAEGRSVHAPVVTFLYHKIKDGQLETEERVVIWLGTGEGEHPDHAGQPASVYLIGPHIGNIDSVTQRFRPSYGSGDVIESKHFSFACITGASEEGPILANPEQATVAT